MTSTDPACVHEESRLSREKEDWLTTTFVLGLLMSRVLEVGETIVDVLPIERTIEINKISVNQR